MQFFVSAPFLKVLVVAHPLADIEPNIAVNNVTLQAHNEVLVD